MCRTDSVYELHAIDAFKPAGTTLQRVPPRDQAFAHGFQQSLRPSAPQQPSTEITPPASAQLRAPVRSALPDLRGKDVMPAHVEFEVGLLKSSGRVYC
jgi:hypothetical protein